MAVDSMGPSSLSHWHAVRPWSPRFLLTVREVTSVSATFELSSQFSSVDAEGSLSSLGLISPSDDDETWEDVPLVSEALARGLSVNVNGATWKRVLMRMDDVGDVAVIILYGLMPGRQYDIELGVVSANGEEIVHSRMVTQPQSHSPVDDYIVSPVQDSSSSRSDADYPPSRPISHDEYVSQLRQQLSMLNSERDSLNVQLKSARKDSQKADASVRQEIDTLKKAAERSATTETRGKQRVLALQETVKQTLAATKEAEALVAEIEASLPALREKEQEAEELHAIAVKEEEESRASADEVVRADKKRVGELQSELTSASNRLDRLTAKRDKLTNETIPDLEEQLSKLIREVELVERDAGAFEVIDNGPVAFDLNSNQFDAPGLISLHRIPDVNLSNNSTLSSRAPPFEPGSAFRRGNSSNGGNFATQQAAVRTPPAQASALKLGGGMSQSSSSSSSPTPTSVSTPASGSGDNSPKAFSRGIGQHFPLADPPHTSSRSRPSGRLIAPPSLSPGIILTNGNSTPSYPFDLPPSHSHTQSWDPVSPIGGDSAFYSGSGIRRRPSPARQSSLPSHAASSSSKTSSFSKDI